MTIVAPADQKSVAAIEKLIGQSIPWKGDAPRATDPEHGEAGEDRRGEHRKREHRGGGRRGRGRERTPQRDGATAPVARLDDARPHRPAKPALKPVSTDDASDGAHLPAFLLRPVRLKA